MIVVGARGLGSGLAKLLAAAGLSLLAACGGAEESASDAASGVDGGPAVQDASPVQDASTARDAADSGDAGVAPSDGGSQGDASADGGMDAGSLALVLVVVVQGPAPVTPLAGVFVRAESASGAGFQGTTGSNGAIQLSLPSDALPVSVTAAKAGYTAASILGVSGPIAGPVRLDPLPSPSSVPTPAVNGTISGKSDPNNLVQLDGWEFNTVLTGGDTFSSFYFFTTPQLPFMLAALEISGTGDVVNAFATPIVARNGNAITADVAFPSPARQAIRTRVLITLPTSPGRLSGQEATVPLLDYVARFHPGEEGAWALVGKQRVLPPTIHPPPDYTWELQTFDADLQPDIAQVALDFPAQPVRLNVYLHAFGTDRTVAVGQVDEVTLNGSSLADLSLLVSSTGYDAAVIGVGEDPTASATWRVFLPPNSGRNLNVLPKLPTGVTLADIGIGGASVSVGAVVEKMHSGSPWSTRGANGGQVDVEYSVGCSYTTVSTAFR